MKHWLLLGLVLSLFACEQSFEPALDPTNLAQYLELNATRERAPLIACAGGKQGGLSGQEVDPTSVFFLPIEGAREFRYFEAEDVADSMDFTRYTEKILPAEPVFNGKLMKFLNPDFPGERMGIVTYKTDGKIHVCDPIRQKTNPKPTEVNPDLITVSTASGKPSFSWQDGRINENVIYFQVVSDSSGNFISGTYTFEPTFTYYELDNVVLNITDPNPPALITGETYNITLMGVSEDNWVNLLAQRQFIAP